MTEKLRELLKRAETWPQDAQEEAVASLEAIEHELVSPELTIEDREALERSAEDVRLGQFASDENLRKVFGRYRRQ
jgi:hypothetical protein